MSEKCSNDEGSVKENSITKWMWFIQEHSTTRMQGNTHEQVTSFPPRPTLEPLKELTGSLANWVVPYEQLFIYQQRATWFMDGCYYN